MGYTVPNIGFARERNLTGGTGVNPSAKISITAPESIEGSSVTIRWELNGVLADTFRITIGSTQTDAQIADSGEVVAAVGNSHRWTFTNRTFPTDYVWITVRHRFGNGAWNGVQRRLKVNIDSTPIDPDINLNWLDDTIWDDDEVWTE